MFVVEALDELLGGVAEEAAHAVNDAHRLLVAVLHQPHLGKKKNGKKVNPIIRRKPNQLSDQDLQVILLRNFVTNLVSQASFPRLIE